MTTSTDRKKMITEIFEALQRAGKVKYRKDFFEPMGILPGYASDIMNHKKDSGFPEHREGMLFDIWKVNPEWWRSRKGSMFIDSDLPLSHKNDTENVSDVIHNGPPELDIAKQTPMKIVSAGGRRDNRLKQIERDIIPIPIVEKRAQAGYALDYADPEYIEHLPKIYVSKEFEKGNYVAFEVSGDSMDDDRRHAICDGDVVLAKELPKDLWRDKLHFGKYLFVVVYNEGCVIKQITNHDPETGDITCHPFNPFFEDFTINLKDVYQLLYVVKVVDRSVRI